MLANGWITIPAGSVKLEAGGYLLEPATFEVEAFAISRCPVTNTDFAAFIEAGGYENRAWWTARGWQLKERYGWVEPRHWYSGEWNRPEYPIVGVSLYEALAYCEWVGAATGQAITIPTEQQWQRAAQGDDGREYPWGDEAPADHLCNWNRNVDETTPVTQYAEGASPYGVLDMSGNVWEWCLTGWESGAADPASREAHVLRGGSWSSDSPISLRAAHRSPKDPNARLDPGYRNHVTVGFRCVRKF